MSVSVPRQDLARDAFALVGVVALLGLFVLLLFASGDAVTYFRLGGIGLHVCALLTMVVFQKAKLLGKLPFWFVLMVTLYHALPEVFNLTFGGGQAYRKAGLVPEDQLGFAGMVSGAFSLVFSVLSVVFYALASRAPSRRTFTGLWVDRLNSWVIFGWLVVAYAYGAGLKNLVGDGQARYLLDALLSYPLLPVLALCIVKILRLRQRGVLASPLALLFLVLLTIVYVFLINERISLAVAVAAALYTALRYDIYRPRAPQVLGALVVLFVLFSGLVFVRAAVGRTAIVSATPVERITLLFRAFDPSSQGRGGDSETKSIAEDFGYRLDAAGYFSAIAPYVRSRGVFFDPEPYVIAASLSVPSFLWPGKLDQDISRRSVEYYISHKASLRNPNFDYLPTLITVIFASGGLIAVFAAAALISLLLIMLERFMSRSGSLVAGLMGVCVMIAITFMERDITIWAVSLRNLLVLLMLLSLVNAVQFLKSRKAA